MITFNLHRGPGGYERYCPWYQGSSKKQDAQIGNLRSLIKRWFKSYGQGMGKPQWKVKGLGVLLPCSGLEGSGEPGITGTQAWG